MLKPYRTLAVPRQELFRGGALSGATLFTWGDSLLAWDLAQGRERIIVPPNLGGFEAAGCLFGGGFVLQQQGRLMWLHGGAARAIDSEIQASDILPATLFDRRGVLVLHKHAQVRFYERPAGAAGEWPSRDLYSIYTASRQAGLLLHDVDGDGRTDLFCGNYWMRSPESFELPWRLFNIQTWFEDPDSATLRLAYAGGALFACQAERNPARAAWFTPGPDPKERWNERRLSLELRNPRGLAALDGAVLIAEDAGEGSRLVLARPGGEAQVLGTTGGIHSLLAGATVVAGIGARSISLWKPDALKD